MKIEHDIKLDFSDVLIRPKRSKLNSRSEVNLVKMIFPNSKQVWNGVPIMVANMDTTGTIEMFHALAKNRMLTCLHKFVTAKQIIEAFDRYKDLEMNELHPINYFILSTGITESNWVNLNNIINELEENDINLRFICIDVANGYMEKLHDFCRKVRKKYPDKIIIAGNVVTREIVEELIMNCGVDIVKVGIGSGCFKGDTRILMANGIYKNISDIKKGDYVINKFGNPTMVLNKFNKGFAKVMKINTNNWHNETVVTDNHRFFVKDLSSGNEEYKWKQLNQMNENDNLLLPNNFQWNLPENFQIDIGNNTFINSNYDLGYIFGSSLVNKKNKNNTIPNNILEELNNKELPSKYYCTNKEYIKGIYNGLNRNNINSYGNKILELYKWCQMNLGITSDNKFKCSEITNKQDVYEEVEVYDIEVNCPSHSFIANNSIVHNSVCTTRLQTGVGMPQFSAVIECADAAHGLNGHIISDGGVKYPGDFSKAFGGGADFVMAGSMFAGYDESGGEVITSDGKSWKIFYGMSSSTCMNKYHGGVAKYRSSEGKTVKVPYKGAVQEQLNNIMGGIRSTCTYVGAKRLKDLPKCCTFMRVNNQVNTKYSNEKFSV